MPFEFIFMIYFKRALQKYVSYNQLDYLLVQKPAEGVLIDYLALYLSNSLMLYFAIV